jgi:hypothetical protein
MKKLTTKKSKFAVIAITSWAIAQSVTGCSSASDSTVSNSESSQSADAVGYRYWGYSQSNQDGKSWVTAMEGPATTNPVDGSVEGWNYTFSAEGVVDPTSPTAQPDFAALCNNTTPVSGEKRVGFVIEFGNPAIYPEGDQAPEASSGCASVPVDATGLDVLNKAADVRAGEGGFICGINGFPSKDCGADAIPVPADLKE